MVTLTDTLIPYHFKHSFKHKLSSFHALINRAFNIPLSNKNKIKEINVIKQLAYSNGYPIKLIYKLLKKKKQNIEHFYFQNNKTEEIIIYKSVTYQSNFNQKMNNIFKDHNITLAEKTSGNLANLLCNYKPKTPLMNSNGVYKLICKDCEYSYIGETGRQLNIRIKEHQKINSTSQVAKHIKLKKHEIDLSKTIIIHKEDKYIKRTLWEAYEIQKALKNNEQILNIQEQMTFKPLFNTFI